MLLHMKRQVGYTMRNLFVMFVTAVFFLLLPKLKWPNNKNFLIKGKINTLIDLSPNRVFQAQWKEIMLMRRAF